MQGLKMRSTRSTRAASRRRDREAEAITPLRFRQNYVKIEKSDWHKKEWNVFTSSNRHNWTAVYTGNRVNASKIAKAYKKIGYKTGSVKDDE